MSHSALFLAKKPTYSKTMHIDFQYHFVRDMVGDVNMLLVNVDTLKNVANALTMSMITENFLWHRGTMGVTTMDW